jgi:hypothetical protein
VTERARILSEARRARIAVNLGGLAAVAAYCVWMALTGAPNVRSEWVPITFIVAFYAGMVRGAATMVIKALGGPDA